MFFSFQILVLLYELFTSLAFFSHYPGDNQSHEVYLQLSDETIILCLQSLLDLFTSRIHPPWTLLGLLHNRKLRMGILKHPAERGLHSHFFCHRSPFFQPPTRWWPITRGITYKLWRENYILSANTVGFIYVTCPPSMNRVGAVLLWTAWDGNSEHPAGGGLHGGATPAGCSFLFFSLN